MGGGASGRQTRLPAPAAGVPPSCLSAAAEAPASPSNIQARHGKWDWVFEYGSDILHGIDITEAVTLGHRTSWGGLSLWTHQWQRLPLHTVRTRLQCVRLHAPCLLHLKSCRQAGARVENHVHGMCPVTVAGWQISISPKFPAAANLQAGASDPPGRLVIS
jgi:hypothetical protein